MVTKMWRGPGSQGVSNSSRVTVSNLVEISAFLYKTTFHFDPLSTTDSGNYECEATVTPDPQSHFVLRTTGNDTHAVNVKGESSLRCNCDTCGVIRPLTGPLPKLHSAYMNVHRRASWEIS